ncbi:hypothetical protein [Thermococcus sp. 5-4]|uniref:hypothetical protein n=1 Tax=Thermococcus sp. 5-4 TaxID=2008440 RepID=UPI000B4A5207|nr:hypothetical protein [Thermococcus sp. 5-4]ASA77442.1 hypothetical protein CDI07_03745 [Thermococcus sp. 5-4]
MKRKTTRVEINADMETIKDVLNDPTQFITNWPYVVRVNTREGIEAEIMLPRFIFKFRDTYRFTFHDGSNSHIYEGVGRKSHLTAVVSLREWQKNVSAEIELAYKGRGEFFLGKTLEMLTEGIAKALKDLAESMHSSVPATPTVETALNVDFSDPMSVASFLAKAKMVHSGLHIIGEGKLLEVVMELRGNLRDDVLYVSGITQDGTKSFKLLLRRSQILAVEYRDSDGTRTVKVDTEPRTREALELVSKVEGAYMINVWVPVGGV